MQFTLNYKFFISTFSTIIIYHQKCSFFNYLWHPKIGVLHPQRHFIP